MPPKKNKSVSVELKQLLAKRDNLITQLEEFESYFTDINLEILDKATVAQLKIRYDKILPLYDSFNDVNVQINSRDDTNLEESSLDPQVNTNFINLYFKLVAEVQEILEDRKQDQIPTPTHNTAESNNSNCHMRHHLAPSKIPTFSGKYDEWESFIQLFNVMVHNEKTIPDVQKMFYLKSSLQGEAAKVIHSLKPSSENYSLAIKLLKERYDKVSFAIDGHLQSLFDLPTVGRDVQDLRNLISDSKQHLMSLKALKLPVDQWDTLAIFIIKQKLDPLTRKEWELFNKADKLPTLQQFYDFLEHRCYAFETYTRTTQERVSEKSHKKPMSSRKTFQVQLSEKSKCPHCQEEHMIFNCEKFAALSIPQRIEEIKRLKLCINCLKANHFSINCKSSSCKKCSKKHNTLLHLETKTPVTTTLTSAYSKPQIYNFPQILLSTAIIYIEDHEGKLHNARVLLDSASQSNFITNSFLKKLQLKSSLLNVSVKGITDTTLNIKNYTTATIRSRHTDYTRILNFLVIKQITDKLPEKNIQTSNYKIPKGINLADPIFHNSSEIDILLGAEVFYELLSEGQIKISQHCILQNTVFGWIVSLTIPNSTNKSSCLLTINQDVKDELTQFWEIETEGTNPENHKNFTQQELQCEEHFIKTTVRDSEGRFIVKLPTNENINKLGDSREMAIKRFQALERRLQANEDLKTQYVAFIREYIALGHMKKINDYKSEDSTYYLPHHAVTKSDSLTTKLRVVFDASAKSSSGISLNDCLFVGPTLQDDLLSILIRFRIHRYAFTSDITKMYRQVQVCPDNTKYQRIIWRETPEDHLETYELQTVTYGTASAPYLAIRSLRQLAEETTSENTANVIKQDFYVDDVLTGSNTVQELVSVRNDLIETLKKGNFHLNKWASNETKVLENLRVTDTNSSILILDKLDSIKTLGLQWKAKEDVLHYSTYIKPIDNVTKRTILSSIAQIFDPLGLLGPIIIQAKIIIQELWKAQIDWDQEAPSNVKQMWLKYCNELNLINAFEIPRHVFDSHIPIKIEVHGFADASEVAYGACIYLKGFTHNGKVTCRLLASKSRVAPIKKVTLPRLELCASLLLARLFNKIILSLHLEFSQSVLWTDSTIVLSWISSPSSNYQTFVSNRIAEIQSLTINAKWMHVSTHENPADLLSRGTTVDRLQLQNLWWIGPTWLLSNELPKQEHCDVLEINSQELEIKSRPTLTTCTTINFYTKYSSFPKLLRIIAYCRRFKKPKNKTAYKTTTITPNELQESTEAIIYLIQHEAFNKEINLLKQGQQVSKSSSLYKLNPFLDEKGCIRVGGRLKYSDVSVDQRHPLILPKQNHVTQLIFQHEHIRLLHCGTEQLLATIRLKFWPLDGRRTAKKIIHHCITCFRFRPSIQQHFMGDLPKERVTIPSRPFEITGIDYAGPIEVIESRRRGRVHISKAYIAVFICFSSKAIHIELVTDLTIEAFFSALNRFTSRRGLPREMHSDNSTTFRGADNYLTSVYNFVNENQDLITKRLASQHINWKFIPPRSPHHGGLWESAIKSMKRHFYKIVQNQKLTFEEYSTILTGIEACLNSRPITPLSNDPHDLTVLTPSHFLIGNVLLEPLQAPLTNEIKSLRSKWQHICMLKNHFWQRWSRDYLQQLQIRTKWNEQVTNLQIGQLVLLVEDNLPPLHWSLGRVVELHPGSDGVVRVVSVRTVSSTFKRSVRKVCALPSSA